MQSSSLAEYFMSKSIMPMSLFLHASTKQVDPCNDDQSNKRFVLAIERYKFYLIITTLVCRWNRGGSCRGWWWRWWGRTLCRIDYLQFIENKYFNWLFKIIFLEITETMFEFTRFGSAPDAKSFCAIACSCFFTIWCNTVSVPLLQYCKY